MNDRRKPAPSAGFGRIALLVVLGACIVAGGCGNKMARIEENQLRLQTLVEMNAQQIGSVTKRIEENQQTLQQTIETLRSNTQKLVSDIESAVGEHVALQKSVRAADAAINAKIADIEQKQANLNTLTVASAADINALAGSHAKLQQTLKNDNQTLAKKITAAENDQERLQTEIQNAQAGVARVAASLNAIADEQAIIREAAKIDAEKTDTRLSLIDQKQIDQQNEIQSVSTNVRKIADQIASIQQNLTKLQEVLQNDTQTMINDLAAALDKLKTSKSSSEPAKPPKIAQTKRAASEETKK